MVGVVVCDENVSEGAQGYVSQDELAADAVSAVDHVGGVVHDNYRRGRHPRLVMD